MKRSFLPIIALPLVLALLTTLKGDSIADSEIIAYKTQALPKEIFQLLSASHEGEELRLEGLKFERGEERSQNYSAAAELYKAAFRSGNLKVLFDLARLYENGLGVKRNPRRARRLYELAISISVTNSEALLELARFYDEGITVPVDKELARALREGSSVKTIVRSVECR